MAGSPFATHSNSTSWNETCDLLAGRDFVYFVCGVTSKYINTMLKAYVVNE